MRFQHPDRELQRRAGAVIAGVGLIGRHQAGDIAHYEQLARRRPENGLRIYS